MRNAIIMAGGKGTRMKSVLPKVLHKILNEPMASMVIRSLKEAGAERIVTVVGYQHELVEKELADNSSALRDVIGEHFHIGSGNAKTMLRRINFSKITKEELYKVIHS